jgi:hypothetical protein
MNKSKYLYGNKSIDWIVFSMVWKCEKNFCFPFNFVLFHQIRNWLLFIHIFLILQVDCTIFLILFYLNKSWNISRLRYWRSFEEINLDFSKLNWQTLDIFWYKENKKRRLGTLWIVDQINSKQCVLFKYIGDIKLIQLKRSLIRCL